MTQTSTASYERVADCVTDAIESGFLTKPPEGVLSGFSGQKLVGLLQRLVADMADKEASCYLEIGVFQGLTLLSAAFADKQAECYGIDNFAFLDPQGRNVEIVNVRIDTLALANAHLINLDYEDALENLGLHIGGRKVAVYFIDGPHDYRSQLMCLQLALPHLAEDAVIVIDDCNYRHVRQANRDFLKTNSDFKLLFEAYTHCHPINMQPDELTQARNGWWNGVNVLVRDRAGAIPASFPPTYRNRDLYEHEHVVHALPYGFCAPEAAEVVGALATFRVVGFAKAVAKLARSLAKGKREREKMYASANTYSGDLPTARLAISPTRQEDT